MRHRDDVSKDEIRELLGKGWLTHDGAWFFSVATEMGMEAANRLNKAAIRTMAPLETRRTMKVLRVERSELVDFPTLVEFTASGLGLIMPDSVLEKMHLSAPSPNVMHWEWEPGDCFAFKGMKQIGQIEDYECGVLYRIGCWLEALEIPYEMRPRPIRCMMLETGTCTGDFIIGFLGGGNSIRV
ncbi:MAG: DUF6125 family protein [Candidatus Geothermincolia bacterium]